MKIKSAHSYNLFIAFLIYVIISCALLLPFYVNDVDRIFTDSASYIAAAKQLYLQKTMSTERPFGLSAIIGLPLLLNKNFSDWYLWCWLWQAILWLANIYIISAVVQKLCNKKLALIACLLFALNFSNIAFSAQVLSETTCSFLLMLSLYFFVLYTENKNQKAIAIAISILLMASIFRPTLYAVGILFAVISMLFFVYKKQFVAVLILFISYIPVHIQCVATKQKTNIYAVSSLIDASFKRYLNIKTLALINKTDYDFEYEKYLQADEDAEGLSKGILNNYFDKEAYARNNPKNGIEEFKTLLSDHPKALLLAYMSSLIENSSKGCAAITNTNSSHEHKWIALVHNIIYKISALQNIFYSFFSIIVLPILILFFRKKLLSKNLLLTCFVAMITWSIILLSAINSMQKDRFHIVFVPLIIVVLMTIYHRASKSMN